MPSGLSRQARLTTDHSAQPFSSTYHPIKEGFEVSRDQQSLEIHKDALAAFSNRIKAVPDEAKLQE
jgi:hypothetical protein